MTNHKSIYLIGKLRALGFLAGWLVIGVIAFNESLIVLKQYWVMVPVVTTKMYILAFVGLFVQTLLWLLGGLMVWSINRELNGYLKYT